jgi:calcineurin-like phosphoesterase family protein
MIYFTSDQHFGHANILKYCSRPFSNIEEMNNALLANWNSVVSPEDLVYVIGDITMSYSKGMMKSIFDRLNGEKVLIKGNHDKKHNTPIDAFIEIHDRLHITGEGYDFILVHDPSEAAANHMDDQEYLCGHLHSFKEDRIYRNWIDCGVDANDFTPISLEQILKLKLLRDESKKGLSTDELLLATASSYNKYA